MEYSDKLKSPKWQKKRLQILERDNWQCQYCKDTETQLQVHHLKYSGEPWDAKNEDLITACSDCHNIITKSSYVFDKIHKRKLLEHNGNKFMANVMSKDGVKSLIIGYVIENGVGSSIEFSIGEIESFIKTI